MQTCASVSDLAAAGKRIGMASRALSRIALTTPTGVWQVRLDPAPALVQHCTELLSSNEHLRSQRFHDERGRRRFVVARGMLRVLLGNQLGVSPASITFGYTSHGKPFVVEPAVQVHFNVSHSQECALYAVSCRYRLGVDIEYLHRDIDHNAVARRFFAAGEYSELQQLPASLRRHAFLACWTRKEAVIKALGDGLSLPLDQFKVTRNPHAIPRVIAFSAKYHNITDGNLYPVSVGSDYYATVAEYRCNSPTEAERT